MSVRVGVARPVNVNRGLQLNAEQQAACSCLASGCMFWRWHRDQTPEMCDVTNEQHPFSPKAHPLGFCGAAGNPQS